MVRSWGDHGEITHLLVVHHRCRFLARLGELVAHLDRGGGRVDVSGRMRQRAARALVWHAVRWWGRYGVWLHRSQWCLESSVGRRTKRPPRLSTSRTSRPCPRLSTSRTSRPCDRCKGGRASGRRRHEAIVHACVFAELGCGVGVERVAGDGGAAAWSCMGKTAHPGVGRGQPRVLDRGGGWDDPRPITPHTSVNTRG